MLLKKSHVVDFKDYQSSPGFVGLFNFLLKRKVHIKYFQPTWVTPSSLEKLGWLAGHGNFPSEGKSAARLVTNGSSIIHHGFHELMAALVKGSIYGQPRAVLLAESLAACLDVNFALEFFNAYGVDHPEPSKYIKSMTTQFKKKPSLVMKHFNRGLASPFEYYKKIALEMFEFVDLGIRYCEQNGRPEINASTRRKLKRLKFRNIYDVYDFNTFYLYIACHCGFKSDARDHAYVRKVLKIFKASSSIEQLVQNLENAKV